MAHLGQLAASLAHAIKNPLAGISGAIQIIRGTMKRGKPPPPA
jgi:nitrogen-specific signal transduction histidine kinase